MRTIPKKPPTFDGRVAPRHAHDELAKAQAMITALKARALSDAPDGAGRDRVQLYFNMSRTTVSGFEKLSETPVCRNNGSMKVSADVRRTVSRERPPNPLNF